MSEKTTSYQRFPLARRIEHLVMLLSFGMLALTGLPQKYPLAKISVWIVELFGGIDRMRVTHHIFATVLMLGVIWHILKAGYKIFVLRERMSMLPSLQDVKDGWMALMYNLGIGKKFPQMGRYTFEEKLEYWAFVWGAIIMGLTGFLMWNPIFSTKFLPGEWIPAALAAHGGEAVLAVLAIIVWHMYGVHLRHFNKSMWTGKLTEEEMLKEHPLELADIKAGLANRPISPDTLRKRQMVYYPVAGILAVVMLAGVYGFVNGENTAITTVPPQPSPIPIYVPFTKTPTLTPSPTATPAPPTATMTATATSEVSGTPPAETGTPAASGPTWDEDVAPILAAKCLTCHGSAATAGLNLSTYEDAMKGGTTGPVIIPGDSANSLLIIKQEAGGHPGQLTPEELDIVKAWIDAGAVQAAKPTSPPVWEGDIATLLQSKCGTCHIQATMGGLSMSTYADIIKGGQDGPVIMPGNGASSLLISIQEAGGHPGQLTPEEIAHVIDWIDAGALEK
jgi:cytochrome b subunit of formate dehydrogenase